MTIVGSASIQIRADDKFFEPDVRRAVGKLKNVTIDLRVNADITAASKKIRDLRYRLTQNDIQIKIRANDANFEADVRAAVRKIKNVSIDLKADTDISRASKKIRDLRYRITNNTAVLKVDADMKRAEEKMRKFLEKFTENKLEFNAVANTKGANTALQELKDRFSATRVPFTAQANTKAANAALAFTARRRRARIIAEIDPRTTAALQGLLNTLTGTLPVDKIKGALTGIASNFEGIVVKGTSAIAVLGALGASAVTLGANIFSIGGDVAQVIGISAILPAAFIALGTAIAANKMAWKGFGDAVNADADKLGAALAKLPAPAQEAVLALRGVGTAIRIPTQNAFWNEMNHSIENAVDSLVPQLITGFTAIGAAMGKLQGAGIQAMGDFFGGGVLEGILKNVAEGIDNAAVGAQHFMAALATLGRVGATYLPALGDSIYEAANNFNGFIQSADRAGKIDDWIQTSVRRFQELGSVVKSTTSILSGIMDVARASGAPGLTEMAEGLAEVADIVNGEPFQSRLQDVFIRARAGTDALGDGLEDLIDFAGRSATSLGDFLEVAGQIGGLAFTNITALFDGTGLGSGLYTALLGLKDALDTIEPAFGDIGTAVGDLGRVAGTLLTSMAPGINMLAETISGVIAGLADGFIAAMPPLNQFVQALLLLVQGPVIALAEGIGNILEVFGELPGGIQTAIAAFGLFLLMKGKLDTMWSGIQTGATRAWTGVGKAATDADGKTKTAAQNINEATGRVAGSMADHASRIGAAWGTVPTAFRDSGDAAGRAETPVRNFSGAIGSVPVVSWGGSLPNAFRDSGGAADRAAGPVRNFAGALGAATKAAGATAGGGVRMAAGGLMSLLGGPWGVALLGATAALGMFAQSNADAKAQVETLKGTLDEATGAFTELTRKELGKDILNFDGDGALGKLKNFFNAATETSGEILDKMGANLDEITEKLTDPKGSDAYINAWKDIGTAGMTGAEISEELAEAVGLSADALNSINGKEVEKVANQIVKAGEAAAKAQKEHEELADKMGVSSIQAQKLAANYATLESTSSSVSEKLSALKSNLDMLSDGKRSALDAEFNYQNSLGTTASALEELKNRQGVVAESLVSTSGAFNMTSQAGRDLYSTLSDSADSILEVGVQAFDAARKGNKSMEEATAAATNAMGKPIAELRQQLADFGFKPGQIDGIISSLDLIPEEVTTALYADGDQALMDAARVSLMLEAFAEGKYEAVLGALPQSAKDAIGAATGLADEFAEGEYEAILLALDKTPGGREAALAALATFDGTDWEAYLKANNLIPEGVADANKAAEGLIDEKTMDLAANDTITDVLEDVNSYDFEGKKIDLTADDLITDVLDQVNSASLDDKGNNLTTTDLVTDIVRSVNEKQLDGKLNTLQTTDLVTAVMDVVNAKTLDGKSNTLTTTDLVTEVLNVINGTTLDDKSMLIVGKDNTASAVASALRQLRGLPPLTEAEIKAIDEASGTAAKVKDNLLGIPNRTDTDIFGNDNTLGPTNSAKDNLLGIPKRTDADIFGTDNTLAPTNSAKNNILNVPLAVHTDLQAIDSTLAGTTSAGTNMSSLPDVYRNHFAVDNTAPGKNSAIATMNMQTDVYRAHYATDLTEAGKASAVANMGSAPNVTRALNALDATAAGKNSAVTNMGATPNVTRSLFASDATLHGVKVARAMMNSLQNVTRTLNAENRTGPSVNFAQATMNSMHNVTRDIFANNAAWGGVSSAQAAINSVHGKTVDIVTRHINQHVNANGGFYGSDGVRAFADGGIMDGVKSHAVKAYAGGGVENHTAQIARGAWPVRIWAEPETGGEAYIPLAKSKRKRSLDILRLVMAEFGITAAHKFDKGGIIPASSTTPSIISNRYATTAPAQSQAAAAGVGPNISLTVNPSQKMSEEQIGEAAAKTLYWNLMNR